MNMSAFLTPLYDQLDETVKFIWGYTTPLFLDCDDNFRNPDVFVLMHSHLTLVNEHKTGLLPPYRQCRFMRIAKWSQGLPDCDSLRKEINHQLISLETDQQREIFFSKIKRTNFRIESITNFALHELPIVQEEWTEKIKKSINIINNKEQAQIWLAKTGQTEIDLLYYKDHAWPDTLTFLEHLSPLCCKIGIYGWVLDEIMKFQLLWATDTTAPSVPSPTTSTKPLYKTFTDLFVKPEYVESSIDALRSIDPPLINDKGEWIGRRGSKAKFAAFIRRLKNCNKIHFVSDKKLLVVLAKNYFPGLDLGKHARTMADPDLNALDEFSALILP